MIIHGVFLIQAEVHCMGEHLRNWNFTRFHLNRLHLRSVPYDLSLFIASRPNNQLPGVWEHPKRCFPCACRGRQIHDYIHLPASNIMQRVTSQKAQGHVIMLCNRHARRFLAGIQTGAIA